MSRSTCRRSGISHRTLALMTLLAAGLTSCGDIFLDAIVLGRGSTATAGSGGGATGSSTTTGSGGGGGTTASSTTAGSGGDPTGSSTTTGSGGATTTSSTTTGSGGGGGTSTSSTTTGSGGAMGTGGDGGTTGSSGGAAMVCTPGMTISCYTGPISTKDLGACTSGASTCFADGSGFGPCEGEVLPVLESCNTSVDDDCDGEINEEGEGCLCVPSSQASCYTGPLSTDGIGACKPGVQTCTDQGTGYGPCLGEVTPQPDACATPEDEDCDGVVASCGPCPEPSEPKNDSESDLYSLGTISCFKAAGGFVTGILSGPSDADWYWYHGNQTNGCFVDPTVGITASGQVRVCQYFNCPAGQLQYSCPAGSTPASSPAGRPGCCSFSGFTVFPFGCLGMVNDNTPVRIRVDNPNQLACEPYTLTYHY